MLGDTFANRKLHEDRVAGGRRGVGEDYKQRPLAYKNQLKTSSVLQAPRNG